MGRESGEKNQVIAKRLLVIAPHVDDEIACAATIARARGEGAEVFVYAISTCAETLPALLPDTLTNEFQDSCAVLGAKAGWGSWPVRRLHSARQEILDRLISLRRSFRPDVVICPSSTDCHQDHAVVHRECMRAFRNAGTLLGWESPNNQRSGRLDYFIQVTREHLTEKLIAHGCYKSQQFRTHLDRELWSSLAIVRGRQCRSDTGLAEAFETLGVRQ